MDKKCEIHNMLDLMFDYNKDLQYKWLNRMVGKSHVAALNGKEVDKVYKNLKNHQMVPEYVWKRIKHYKGLDK